MQSPEIKEYGWSEQPNHLEEKINRLERRIDELTITLEICMRLNNMIHRLDSINARVEEKTRKTP